MQKKLNQAKGELRGDLEDNSLFIIFDSLVGYIQGGPK